MKNCYICGQDKLAKRIGKVRDNDRLDVLECSSCGLITLSDFSHIQDGFYESSMMRKNDKEQEIKDILQASKKDDERRCYFVWDEIFNNYYINMPTNPKAALHKAVLDRKILDYGCGAGGFLLKLSNEFDKKNLYGVELEKKARDYVLSQEIKTFKDIKEFSLENVKLDYITMFHVLEHISDPIQLLIELKDFLNENGKIIIEVPNANDALLSLYRNESFEKYFWSPHFFTFNKKSFEVMAKKAGYELNYINYVQRYSLANHLGWLVDKAPGGHTKCKWATFIDDNLEREYERALKEVCITDTLIVELEKGENNV